jgi:flavodoxin
MNVLVAYYSESDNTRKLADALASGLGTQAICLEAVKWEALPAYDLICIGTPVQGARPARKVMEFVSRLPLLKGKRCAAFCTMHAFGDTRTLRILKKALEAKGMVSLGGCSARGWSRLVANFGPRIFNRGRPNQEELARAAEFGRSLLVKMARPPAAPRAVPATLEGGLRGAPMTH